MSNSQQKLLSIKDLIYSDGSEQYTLAEQEKGKKICEHAAINVGLCLSENKQLFIENRDDPNLFNVIQNPFTSPIILKEEKPHLSHSQLNLLMMCGEKYRRRYIEGERRPGGVQLHRGGAGHYGFETYLKMKMQSIEMSLSSLEQMTLDHFSKSIDEEGILIAKGDNKLDVIGKARDQLVLVMGLFHKNIAQTISPKEIELKYRIVLPDCKYDILVIIDLIDTDNNIRDYKITAKTMSQYEADYSRQLTLYELAFYAKYGFWANGVGFDNFVVTKTNKLSYNKLTSKRTKSHFETFENFLVKNIELLEKGIFLPRPCQSSMDWHCSEKYCEFFNDCKYVPKIVK